MNKLVSLSLILTLVLVGCVQTSPTITTPPTPTVQTATSTPTVQPTPTPAAEPTPTPQPTTAQNPVAEPTSTPQAAPEPTRAEGSALAWTPDGVIGEGEYAGFVEAGGVQFHWSSDAEFLYGALSAQTTGWVSVGFDPQNKMQGANYVFGYVKDGQLYIEDMFGIRPIGSGSHPPDTELGGRNDIVASSGRELDGVTVVEFKIPLDSGDSNDKPLRAGQSYKIILAWGSRDDFTSIHSGYGYATIEIGR